MLETLREAGYLFREGSDGRYRLTIRVRGLSDGFSDESWVPRIAKPLIEQLCRELVWPIAVATCYGINMLVRETTDKSSPLALRRYSGGFRVPLLGTSSGRVYLAFCSAEQRETLLEVLARSDAHPSDALARNRATVDKILGEVRSNRFAVTSRPDLNDTSLAVPVFSGGRVFAAVVLRYIDSAMSANDAITKYLAPLRATAERIGQEFQLSNPEETRPT